MEWAAPYAVGVLLVIFGGALRAWGAYFLLLNKVPYDIQSPPKVIVNDGPYRYVRHPMYIGALMMIAGLGVCALGFAGVVVVVPALPFYQARMVEERIFMNFVKLMESAIKEDAK